MSARTHRLPVVVDTNVFVRSFKSRSNSSPNRKVIRLWLMERKLQLIVSNDVVAEYLEIFDSVLAMDRQTVLAWRERFADDHRVTLVNLARRDVASRDSDDNVFLSTARGGKAKYLVTNDRDLLDLPAPTQKRLPFAVVRPSEFLQSCELYTAYAGKLDRPLSQTEKKAVHHVQRRAAPFLPLFVLPGIDLPFRWPIDSVKWRYARPAMAKETR